MGVFSIIGGFFHIGALALLLIGTITSPVTQSLYLAEDGDYKYGVFGYCNVNKSSCSSATAANYSVSDLASSSDYIFDGTKRDTFLKILIVFPVACGLTFFSFVIALANLRTATRSSTALSIVSIILAVLAFLASCLACVFTFLVFYPHVKWCAWIQIGSCVLNLIALVFFVINLKLSKSTDDITSMDNDKGFLGADRDDDDGSYSYKNNLLLSEKDNAAAPSANFVMPGFKPPPINATSTSDDSSSFNEKKSINDITVQNNRYPSSNSQVTNTSNGTAPQPNLYSGPNNGTGTRYQAPQLKPQVAEAVREPTLPQIADPYNASSASNLALGDDRNVLRAGQREYNDPNLEVDNNSFYEADSDFTSVSQRAINPKYYHGANAHAGPAQHQQLQQPLGPQAPPQQFGPPPQQYMMQQNPYVQQPQPPQQQQQQFRPRHGRKPSKPNASEMILQSNPDFMVGQGMARKNMTRYGQQAPPPAPVPRMGQNYKNRAAKNQLPPASMTRDSPYGSLV